MSFYERMLEYRKFDIAKYVAVVTIEQVIRVLNNEKLTELDFLCLLFPAAEQCLELMAQRLYKLTVQYFGKIILLYTPIYLSNHCANL